MQKWVWGSFALVVFAGAGVYLAADHTYRHPDSFVGRCAISTLKLTSQVGPVVLNRAASAVPWRGLSQTHTTTSDRPACRHAETPAACMPPADGIEPIVVEVQSLPESTYVQPVAFSTVSRTVRATPTLMPYASEEGDECDDEPGVLGWFGCDKNCCQVIGNFVKAVRQNIGLEQTARAEIGEAVEQLEYPDDLPATPDQGTSNEEEYQGRMQEDPHHHHHYPSCPYTGRCPQPYHMTYPIIPRAEDNNVRRNKPEIPNPLPVPSAKVPETMDAKPADLGTDGEDSF